MPSIHMGHVYMYFIITLHFIITFQGCRGRALCPVPTWEEDSDKYSKEKARKIAFQRYSYCQVVLKKKITKY